MGPLSGFPPGAKGLPQKTVSKDGGITKGQFIIDNKGKIDDSYDIERKKLGEGAYGEVHKAKQKNTGAIRAIKTIDKRKMNNVQRLKVEIAITKMMDHPNIIKLYEDFEDNMYIYLVMELCTGGELFDRIIDATHFTEAQAAHVMQQIIRALFYMHASHVCHRDLKPENFLFQDKSPIESSTLKVIDMGLSCEFKPGQILKTKAGTPYYVAPQVLAGSYDEQSDMWSAGVIMYVLLSGYPPFGGDNDHQILSAVRKGAYDYDDEAWTGVSEDAKSLIGHMLTMDPKKRFTPEKALNHIWIKDKAPKAPNKPISDNVVKNLSKFRTMNRLKQAALEIIANQLSHDSIKELRTLFIQLDKNGDGLLSHAEMKEGLQKCAKIPPDVEKILEAVDSDGSGQIDYTEFLAATVDHRMCLQEEIVWQAFRIFDENHDGVISQKEIEHVLGDTHIHDVMGMDKDSIAALMKEIDTNGDGEIDFQEFMAMMKK